MYSGIMCIVHFHLPFDWFHAYLEKLILPNLPVTCDGNAKITRRVRTTTAPVAGNVVETRLYYCDRRRNGCRETDGGPTIRVRLRGEEMSRKNISQSALTRRPACPLPPSRLPADATSCTARTAVMKLIRHGLQESLIAVMHQ